MAAPESHLDGDPVALIDSLHHDISSRHRELLRAIAEHDGTGGWKRDGCRDMAQWLSGRLGISNWTARRWVNASHALESLPRLSDALATGALGLDKVVELARFATPESEKELIAWTTRVSPAAVRRKADAATRASLDDVPAVEHARYLQWWWFDDGKRMGLEGEFPAAQGATIAKALTRVAATIPDMPTDDLYEGGDPTPEMRAEQRRADALWALASGAIAADPDADRATVVVHTTLDSVTGAEIEGGPVIHPETAARLTCDARLQYVLTDRAGNALGIGHTARDIPAWLMRYLRHRDRGCTFPGCGMSAFVHAHHIDRFPHGPTDPDNLVLVCQFHHKLVHEFRWRVALNGHVAEWYRPSGRRYFPGPDPPRTLPGVRDDGAVFERRGEDDGGARRDLELGAERVEHLL